MIALGDATFEPGGEVFGSPASPVYGTFLLNTPVLYLAMWNEAMRGLPAGDPGVQATKRRHGGRWNIGFCDGHVENLRPTSLFNLSNSIIARRWNVDHQPHNEGWVPPGP
jgi:prepilin-type processing-associated H-X9-DG protein